MLAQAEPIAAAADLLSDPARAAMLTVLLDGRALPATELANQANLSPQAASAHLARLTEARLIEVHATGRHRYYRLANPAVGHAIASLAAIAPSATTRPTRPAGPTGQLRYARTCYGHLAGQVGVVVTDALTHAGWLIAAGQDFALTPAGETGLTDFGLDLAALRRGRRQFARQCIDWSERRPHLGGALGQALTAACFERGWLTCLDNTRAVALTEAGRRGLRDQFGAVIPTEVSETAIARSPR